MILIFQPPWPKFAKLQESRPTLLDWTASLRVSQQVAGLKPGVVVVRDPYSTALGRDWKPSAKYAALAVDRGTLGRLRQALLGMWTSTLISRVIVELNPAYPLNTQVSSAHVLDAFSEVTSLPYSYILQSAPAGPVPAGPVPAGLPLVISPKTLDEAVDLATPITPQTTAATA